MRRKFCQAIAVIVLCAVPALAINCPKGSYEYKGDCEVDIQPEIAQPVKPSDEKPPTDKMPSYEREGVTVVTAPNLNDSDVEADKAKFQADQEGKKAAGVFK